MKCTYSCHSPDHKLARRRFLAGMAATAAGAALGGLDFFTRPAAAAQLEKDQKRVVLFNMHGGLSQLESWDPEARHRDRRPIPRDQHFGSRHPDLGASAQRRQADAPSLPGARRQHREDDHGKGAYLMTTGRRQTPAAEYPMFGAVCAKAMAPEDESLPGPHRDHARWRRRSRQRRGLPGPQVLEHRAGQRQPAPVHQRGPAT